MDTKRAFSAFALTAGLVTALAGCRIDITPEPGDPGVPPVGTPVAVTFDGDAGLDAPFTVVAPDDADLATEVEAGVYTSAGPLANGDDANSCKFVQSRTVNVAADVVVEVAVSDPALDEDQADVAEPAAEVVEDDPATPEEDLKVTLLEGDTFATQGCEDWVKVAEVDADAEAGA